MALDMTHVLGRGQFLWDVASDPKALYIGDGIHTIAELPNVIDRSDILAALAALSGATLKVNAAADAKTIEAALNDVKSLIAGAKMGIVFDTEAHMNEWLAEPATYAREDGATKADLVPGQAIYILEEDVPDYWWDGTQVFEAETRTDLSGYSTTSQVNTAIEAAVDAAVDALPAHAKSAPPNDGHAYAVRDGAYVRIMLGVADLTV